MKLPGQFEELILSVSRLNISDFSICKRKSHQVSIQSVRN